MSEIIVLSDSEEFTSPVENHGSKEIEEPREKNSADDFSLIDEFPEVFFDHDTNRSRKNSPAAVDHPGNCPHELKNHDEPSSSSEEDSPAVFGRNYDSNERRHGSGRAAHVMSDSCESGNDSDNDRQVPLTQIVKKGRGKNAEERLRKKEQLARERALKAISLKKLRDIKPGECMKYMEVMLDEGVEGSSFGGEIKNALVNADIKYSIGAQLVPNSITWKRRVEENYLDENNKMCTALKTDIVDQAMVIWTWDEVIHKVADKSFSVSVSSIKSLLPDCNLTLIIFGAQSYFASRKSKKSGRQEEKKRSQKSNKNTEYADLPDVSRKQLETSLNEIQVTIKCNSRLIDTAQDLALCVCQYTKAIAETPYKKEKSKNLTNKFDWYVMGDNRNTVRVDKEGNGLKRLWQQQLCQFNLSSLEIAEAICSVYPSPAHLMEAYTKSTEQEGINL